MIQIKNCTAEEFKTMLLSGIDVVCFGAGVGLHELCRKYPELSARLICAVDNFKTGDLIVGDRTIPIRPVEKLESVEGGLCIVSSLRYADELVRQLDQLAEYDGMEFYFPSLFTTEREDGAFLRTKNAERKIPKRIHYCWFGGSEMPEKFRANIDTWRRCCPDYEIVRWDESNYDIEKNHYMKQTYESKYWAFVPDYARLDVVHQYGGIYLDTDVELLRPLDDLLACNFFCGFESVSYIALGLGFGGEKNTPLLEEMMESYEQTDFIRRDGSLNLTPSPKYQTKVLVKHGLIPNGRTQITPEFTALSAEYLCPINLYGVGQPTANSFSIHQYAATWLNKEQREDQERLTRNYKYILARINGAN